MWSHIYEEIWLKLLPLNYLIVYPNSFYTVGYFLAYNIYFFSHFSKSGAMLELVDKGSSVDAFQVKEDFYVNITFVLNTKRCKKIKDCFKVKVVKIVKDFSVSICNIVFNGTCNASDCSHACRCLNQSQKLATLYTSVSPTDKVFGLEWTDCTNGTKGNSSFTINRM